MRYVTVAIHTFDRALALRTMLEREGIEVVLQNINLTDPSVATGVRVRIPESDLPLALRIIENADAFTPSDNSNREDIHSILVPTDFSDHSLRAAIVGARLAAAHSASLRLLHAYLDPYVAANMQLTDNLTYEIADADTRTRLENEAKTGMQNFIASLSSELKQRTVAPVGLATKIVEGVPEDAIVDYGKSNPPLLVVMGTRGSARKERELIGSVSAEVLDAGRFSVLTVPEPLTSDSLASPKRVLFFSNLDQTDMLALDSFARLMHPADGVEVCILNIGSRKRFARIISNKSAESMLMYCRSHYPAWSFDSRDVDAADTATTVLRMNCERPFDLIVVPNRRKNAFSRVFNPGPANTMLFRADLPMLVIPV